MQSPSAWPSLEKNAGDTTDVKGLLEKADVLYEKAGKHYQKGQDYSVEIKEERNRDRQGKFNLHRGSTKLGKQQTECYKNAINETNKAIKLLKPDYQPPVGKHKSLLL